MSSQSSTPNMNSTNQNQSIPSLPQSFNFFHQETTYGGGVSSRIILNNVSIVTKVVESRS